MAKFKKGDRVEVIDQDGDPRARIGDKGTVVGISHLDDEATLIVGTDKGKQIEMFEWRFKLITTTMNDNDKVETTVANIKAAHAKGCDTGKAMIEALFPKVFEKDNIIFDPKKIYALKSRISKWRLVEEKDGWCFRDILGLGIWRNHSSTAQFAINNEDEEDIKVFDTELEFAKWATS